MKTDQHKAKSKNVNIMSEEAGCAEGRSMSEYDMTPTLNIPQEFQKALGSKQPVYDTTVRSGRAMRDRATLPADGQKLEHLLGEVRDKWDTVCGKSVER